MAIDATEIKFGTDGWRAVVADAFTFPNVRRVAAGIAEVAGGGPVLIGYDTRFIAKEFATEAGRVLTERGVEVIIAEEDAPTPVIAWTVVQQGLKGALVFTASHNPARYQGMKFIAEYGGPALPEVTDRIERAIPESVPPPTPVELREAPVRSAYVTHMLAEHLPPGNLVIVLDPMHGTGRRYLPALLGAQGSRIRVVRDTPDPLFGGGMPEPLPAHLQPLIDAVQQDRAHLGLATDGDADRFGAVDAGGRVLTANEVLALLTAYLFEIGRSGRVVRTVATTHLLDRIASAHGQAVTEVPVGFKWIAREMLRGDVLIGGEESGGLSIGGHIPEKDGLLANLLIAQARAHWGRPLGSVLAGLHERYGASAARRADHRVSPEVRSRVTGNLLREPPGELAGTRVLEVDGKDGVRLSLDGGAWLLVRPSGTEPLVRIYAEAESDSRVDELLGAATALLH